MGFQRSSDKLATSFAPVPCSTSDLRPNSPSFASIYCECVNCESHAHKSNTEYVRSSALRLSLDPLLQHCRVLSETPLSGPRWPTSLNIKKKKRNHRSRQPRRKWASALEGAGAEGQHRATPTRAAAPEAPPEVLRDEASQRNSAKHRRCC